MTTPSTATGPRPHHREPFGFAPLAQLRRLVIRRRRRAQMDAVLPDRQPRWDAPPYWHRQR